MQSMGSRHGPVSHTVGGRPILVRRHVWRLAPHLLATHHTPAHRYPVSGALGAGHGGEIGRRGTGNALLDQGPSGTGTSTGGSVLCAGRGASR
jgi:hypothetical protein